LARWTDCASTAEAQCRRRAAIARALSLNPDVLLLDEPTNHLDLGAIEWLENWLNRFSGAFIVISHDRTFLTRLTRETLWIDRGKVRRAEVGFGGFEAWQEKIFAEEERAAAVALPRALGSAARFIENGTSISEAIETVHAALTKAGFAPADYVELVDAVTLQPIEKLDRPARILAAARLGKARLIDNLPVTPAAAG
jgi:ATPase subunit of ABC transporter with duplicated ATPase domains